MQVMAWWQIGNQQQSTPMITLLSYWGLNKMDNILKKDIFNAFFKKIFVSWCKHGQRFLPMGPIDNESTLVQFMAWSWTGDKPLTETMMTQFYDTVWVNDLPYGAKPIPQPMLTNHIKNISQCILCMNNFVIKLENIAVTHPLGQQLLTHCSQRYMDAILKTHFTILFYWWYLQIYYHNALRLMPQDFTVEVMAWCCQAASYYLGQCWPRSTSP